jgi:ketosteroid isomerase-like protein
MEQEQPLERVVKRIWRAFDRQGLEAMLSLVPPDVQWEPIAGAGAVLNGRDELRAFWAETTRAGRSSSARAYRYQQVGTCVLVTGSLRESDPTGLRDTQPTWVYFFDGEQLRRAVGYRTRADALAAVQAHCGAAA